MVTSPQIGMKEYLEGYSEGMIDRDEIIKIMVGDLQRIKIYPELGFRFLRIFPKRCGMLT